MYALNIKEALVWQLSPLPVHRMIWRVSKTPRSCSSQCSTFQKPELVLRKLRQRLLWTFQRCRWFQHRLLCEGTDEQSHRLEVFALEVVAEQGGEERPSHRTVCPTTSFLGLVPDLTSSRGHLTGQLPDASQFGVSEFIGDLGVGLAHCHWILKHHVPGSQLPAYWQHLADVVHCHF